MASVSARGAASQTQDGVAAESVAQADGAGAPDELQNQSFEADNSDEERRRLIAEAAYFIAQRRDFDGGLELEDWLAAEAEVDAKLAPRSAS